METDTAPPTRSEKCPPGLGHTASEMMQRRYWITDAGRAALAAAEHDAAPSTEVRCG